MKKSEWARRQVETRIYRDAVGLPPDPKWKSLWPMLVEPGFATRVIRKRLKLATPLDTTDRTVLERTIFPHFTRDPAIRDVLFVGCDTYTAHYQREFFHDHNYATIEPDPRRARYGSVSRHVIAPLEELARHFAPQSLDLIVCNGVYGWGLDTAQQCEAAFAQCHECLRAEGVLVFGWDDVPRRCPVPLQQIEALAGFGQYVFPDFGTWRYVTDTPFRHTYDFYQR